jgi:hypothetical protein
MHANIEDLLAINDGEHNSVSEKTREHVQSCADCQRQLNALATTLENVGPTMLKEFDYEPSAEVWTRVQNSIESKTNSATTELASTASVSNVLPMRSGNVQSLTRAVYALAASIAFVGLVSVFMFSGNSQNQQALLLQASVDQLMTNSRGLEQSLQQVVKQNEVLSVANQQAADRLYWRLTYVDQLIQDASPANSEQLQVLWNDRVEALNELNKLYFERDIGVSRSEI